MANYILRNALEFKNVRYCLVVYDYYIVYTRELKAKFDKNYSKICDFDKIIDEVLNLMVLYLMVNTFVKYKS